MELLTLLLLIFLNTQQVLSLVASSPQCIKGTGSGISTNVCSFTCLHGYCPADVCNCTAQGASFGLPAETSDVCVGAPGTDAAVYDSLCAFSCKYGYLPTDACRKATKTSIGHVDAVKVVDAAATPTPAPFVPYTTAQIRQLFMRVTSIPRSSAIFYLGVFEVNAYAYTCNIAGTYAVRDVYYRSGDANYPFDENAAPMQQYVQNGDR